MYQGHASRAQERSQPYEQGGRQTMDCTTAPLDEANGLTNNATGALLRAREILSQLAKSSSLLGMLWNHERGEQ